VPNIDAATTPHPYHDASHLSALRINDYLRQEWVAA
jgi:hypothetical protein